jgi:photosystem I subunit 10
MIAQKLCLRDDDDDDDDDDGEEERSRRERRDRSPPKNQRKKEGCFFSFFFVSFFFLHREKTTLLSDSFVTHHHHYYYYLFIIVIVIQQQQKQKQQHNTRRSVVTRADWSLGSDVNHCVCFNTVALLFAGRFGFAPTVKKNYSGADSYTMTEDAKPAVGTRDPAGFTAVDVLAFGSLAHIVSAGEIFGLHLN